jgi:hypothetical protein
MATRIDDLDKPEISGYAMTHPQHGTVRGFERACYAIAGTCLGAIVLRGRDDDRGWALDRSRP